jgi:hypothetical protein
MQEWVEANTVLGRDAFVNAISHTLTEEEQNVLSEHGYDVRTMYVSNDDGTIQYDYLVGKKLVIPSLAIYVVLVVTGVILAWI